MAVGLVACTSGSASSSGGSASSADASSAATSSESSAASSASSADAQSSASAEASSASAEEPKVDGSAYGYAGEDPVEAEAFRYIAEEMGKLYLQADATIPLVNIFFIDYTNLDDVRVAGDYWVFNYDIDGETLVTASGGNFPGVLHMKKEGESYVVTSFDRVQEGAGFEESARELFGENFEAFSKIHSDDAARKELRTIIVSDYVNLNGLDITQYQDPGWDPIPLYK